MVKRIWGELYVSCQTMRWGVGVRKKGEEQVDLNAAPSADLWGR